MVIGIRSGCRTCGFISEMDGLLESETVVTMKGKFEIHDMENKLIARAVITEKEKKSLGGFLIRDVFLWQEGRERGTGEERNKGDYL